MDRSEHIIEEIECLTVAEFAQRAGVTKQAVYKQLNNRLNKYVIEEKGKKLIKSTALNDLYNDTTIEKSQPVEQPLNNQLIEIIKENQRIITALMNEKATIQMQLTQAEHELQLIGQIKEEDRQKDLKIEDLEELNKRLKEEIEKNEIEKKELEIKLMEEKNKSWLKKLFRQ